MSRSFCSCALPSSTPALPSDSWARIHVLGRWPDTADLPAKMFTTRDVAHLAPLVGDFFSIRDRAVAFLARELDRATIVRPSAVPRGIVTMRSVVRFHCRRSAKTRRAMLVYPGEADASRGKVSVLTPVGTALLGLSEGQVMPYVSGDGSATSLTVIDVLFQPEAIGMNWL